MSLSDQHHRKRAKNWLLFGVLVALAAALFGLSFIRVAALQESPAPVDDSTPLRPANSQN